MAAPSGTEDPSIIDLPSPAVTDSRAAYRYEVLEDVMRKDPWGFQFFQAVRLIERMRPERRPVGRFFHPGREVVRFQTNVATAFPASQIQDLQWPEGRAPMMMINFMGLTGPLGVLPIYYTELLMERVRAKDRTLINFLDLFNHRMISLFYQAWEKYRFGIGYERGEGDRLSQYLLDLIGLGTKGLQRRQAVRDESLLFYAGLLSLHTRSESALERILQDYFEVDVEVDQFVGAWYSLDRGDQCCFQMASTYSEQLGVGAVVGDEIWDQQSGLRIQLGPLTLAQYMDFLPEGSAYEPLRAIARFFAGSELDFEVQLILKREEVPECNLDDTLVDRGEVAPQLGWSTWAKTQPMRRDPGDTILRI